VMQPCLGAASGSTVGLSSTSTSSAMATESAQETDRSDVEQRGHGRATDLGLGYHRSILRYSSECVELEFSEVACPSAPAGAAALPPLPYAS
jgi:hypothetical protein